MPVDSLQKQVGVGEGDAARRQVRSGANWGSSWRLQPIGEMPLLICCRLSFGYFEHN